MGRKSTRQDKNIYWKSREEAGLTREEASEQLAFISDSRIERFENEGSPVQPDEVLAMSRVYKKPELCNYYCARECPIGQQYVPEVKIRDLSQIVLQMLSTINSVERAKDRLIEITADGEISEDELTDFARIEDGIRKISLVSDALTLWIENMTASGKIDKNRLEEIRESLKNGVK